MNKKEFSEAYEIAKNQNISLVNEDTNSLIGCALPDFQYPVYVTVKQVASLIRWDCFLLNGNVDAVELNDIGIIARKKFRIVG